MTAAILVTLVVIALVVLASRPRPRALPPLPRPAGRPDRCDEYAPTSLLGRAAPALPVPARSSAGRPSTANSSTASSASPLTDPLSPLNPTGLHHASTPAPEAPACATPDRSTPSDSSGSSTSDSGGCSSSSSDSW